MKWATPTASTTRRVVPGGTRIVLGPAVLVTGMRGGYRARCIHATWRNTVAIDLAARVHPPYGGVRIRADSPRSVRAA